MSKAKFTATATHEGTGRLVAEKARELVRHAHMRKTRQSYYAGIVIEAARIDADGEVSLAECHRSLQEEITATLAFVHSMRDLANLCLRYGKEKTDGPPKSLRPETDT